MKKFHLATFAQEAKSMDDETLLAVVAIGLALLYTSPSAQSTIVGLLSPLLGPGFLGGGGTVQPPVQPPPVQPPIAQPPIAQPPIVPIDPGVQPPPPPTTAGYPRGTGSANDPIIAMPMEELAAQVRSSLAYWGRDDDDYWITHEDHAGQFSNGLFYAGHNAYWFDRMDPNNVDGSSDPNRAGLPAPF